MESNMEWAQPNLKNLALENTGLVNPSEDNSLNIFSKIYITSEEDQACEDSSLYHVVFYVVFFPVFLVGIFGNCLLLFIIARHKNMRTVPNRYIFNLAVANIFVTVTYILAPALASAATSSTVVCVAAQAVREISTCASIYTLTALSAERYHSIVYPLRRDSGMSASTITTAVVGGVWTFSVVVETVKFGFIRGELCTRCGAQYVYKFENSADNALVSFFTISDILLFYVIPLMSIGAMYILMIQEHYFMSVRFSENSQYRTHVQRLLQVRKRLAWTVLAMVAMFAASFLPFYTYSLLPIIWSSNKQRSRATVATAVLYVTCFHSCANPIILYCLSDSCKAHFKHYLFKWCSREQYPLPLENEHIEYITSENLNARRARALSTPV